MADVIDLFDSDEESADASAAAPQHTASEPPEQLVCPLCGAHVLGDNVAFNTHLDECLNANTLAGDVSTAVADDEGDAALARRLQAEEDAATPARDAALTCPICLEEAESPEFLHNCAHHFL